MAKSNLRLGYIVRYGIPGESSLRFKFRESSYTRRISSKGDRVFSPMLLYPADYEDVESNTKMMEKPGIIIVNEPFFLDEDLRKKAADWVEWANNADPKEYDPFAE